MVRMDNDWNPSKMLNCFPIRTQQRVELLPKRVVSLLSFGKVRGEVHKDHQNAFQVGLPKYSAYRVAAPIRT